MQQFLWSFIDQTMICHDSNFYLSVSMCVYTKQKFRIFPILELSDEGERKTKRESHLFL